MYNTKTRTPAYHRKRITRTGILDRVRSVKGKNYYEPGGDFLIVTKQMQPAMHVFGKIYVEGPQIYKAGRYVYGYENGAEKLLLCEDGLYKDESGYQDLAVGNETKVEDFIKTLRGDLFFMPVRDYEKYMNEKGGVYWVYGGMPLKAGSSVIITKLVMQGRHYPEYDEKEGTILYQFGSNEPKIKLVQKKMEQDTAGGLLKEIVPGQGSVIRPCGW